MNLSSTKAYLKDVIYLESTLQILNNLINKLDNKIKVINNTKIEIEPLSNIEKPEIEKEFGFFIMLVMFLFCLVISSFVINIPFVIILWIIFHKFSIALKISLIISIILGIIFTRAIIKFQNPDIRQRNEEKNKKYLNAVKELEKRNQEKQNRIKLMEIQKNDLIIKRKNLYNQYTETKKALTDVYNLDIIYSKYRYLVAVVTFYEYFDSGRCNSFEATETSGGAYNLYETEIRMNTIIEKLDIVINQLEQVKRNQEALYDVVCHINSTTNKIYANTEKELEELKKSNTYNEITADNSAVTAHNSTILAFNDEIKMKTLDIMKNLFQQNEERQKANY